MPPNNQSSPATPLTKQQIEDKYWLEFIDWLAEDINWTYNCDQTMTDRFWLWIVREKLPKLAKSKGVEAL